MTPSLSGANVNLGIRVKRNRPLAAPERPSELESFLLKRTLETETFHGTPGAHINLNVSNEDFLGRDDNLFVSRHISYDDVHNLVKYSDVPIYDTFKSDNSKAMASKKIFQEAPYDIKIKCIKEEAMIIALKRFLLPQLASNPASAYQFALLRVYTTLTKGCAHLSSLTNHTLPPRVRDEPIELFKKSVTNLEDLVIMKKLSELTLSIDELSSDDDGDSGSDNSAGHDYSNHNSMKTDQSCYAILSNNPLVSSILVSFINESYFNGSDCNPSNHFYAALSVQPLSKNLDKKYLRVYHHSRSNYGTYEKTKHRINKIAVAVDANTSGSSWNGKNIWSNPSIYAYSLQDEVASLGIDGLTEDLLMTWIIALIQSKLHINNKTSVFSMVCNYKTSGVIPMISNTYI